MCLSFLHLFTHPYQKFWGGRTNVCNSFLYSCPFLILLTDRLGDTAVAFPELSEDPEALQRIPLLSNDEIEQEDHEHDLSLINSFDGKVPSPLSHLLVLILVDERMRTLEHRDAQALLEKHPVLEKALLHTWQQKSFRRIRELGTSSMIRVLSGSSTSTSDSKAARSVLYQ